MALFQGAQSSHSVSTAELGKSTFQCLPTRHYSVVLRENSQQYTGTVVCMWPCDSFATCQVVTCLVTAVGRQQFAVTQKEKSKLTKRNEWID